MTPEIFISIPPPGFLNHEACGGQVNKTSTKAQRCIAAPAAGSPDAKRAPDHSGAPFVSRG
ncbi:hypothetical protein GCM10010983_00250 [Caulobacter rhizosphaerae]|nr:hypothetical protein GCM10010983_00250 [Caulobacter rhizosphaerae]